MKLRWGERPIPPAEIGLRLLGLLWIGVGVSTVSIGLNCMRLSATHGGAEIPFVLMSLAGLSVLAGWDIFLLRKAGLWLASAVSLFTSTCLFLSVWDLYHRDVERFGLHVILYALTIIVLPFRQIRAVFR
jgi:hypothetical protein